MTSRPCPRRGALVAAAAGALSLALAACDEPPRMHLERTRVAAGEDVVVLFDDPLRGRATNQYWVALQPASAPEADTSGRVVLDRSTRAVRLRATRAGDYEVRLHAGYPSTEARLVARAPVEVAGFRVGAGLAQLPDPDECLDRWLARHALDPWGSPLGTAYAGGTPAFDERTGHAVSRWEHVASRHPEVEDACAGAR